MDKIKKYLIYLELILFFIVFTYGIHIIYISDISSKGTYLSMNIAGSIISIFGGIGFLIAYIYKNKQK